MLRVLGGPLSKLPKLRLDDDGLLKGLNIATDRNQLHYGPASESINKLNEFLERKGYSLDGEDGGDFRGFKTIKSQGQNRMWFTGGGMSPGPVGGGSYTVAMYGPSDGGGGGGNGRDDNRNNNNNNDGRSDNNNNNGDGNRNRRPDDRNRRPDDRDPDPRNDENPEQRDPASNSARRPIDSPPVQNWDIDGVIRDRLTAENKRLAMDADLFAKTLQSLTNSNRPYAFSFRPPTGSAANPSNWANIMADLNY